MKDLIFNFILNNMKKENKTFLAYYLQPAFWTLQSPDWTLVKECKVSLKEFLGEIIFENNNIGLKFARDGLILVDIKFLTDLFSLKYSTSKNDFISSDSFTSFCLDYMNTVCLLLQSEFIIKNNLNVFKTEKVHDAFILQSKDEKNIDLFENGRSGLDNLNNVRDQFEIRSMMPTSECITGFQNNDQKPYIDWIEKIDLFDLNRHNRQIISDKVLNNLSANMEKIIKEPAYCSIFSVLVSVIEKYHERLFFESIINAWSIIEYFVNKEWNILITRLKSEKRLNKKRKEILNNNDYTASIKSNILEMQNHFSIEVLEKLNKVRSARNKIVHDFSYSIYDSKLGESDKLINICIDSFGLIQFFISKHFEIKLLINNFISNTTILPSGSTAERLSVGNNTIFIETPEEK